MPTLSHRRSLLDFLHHNEDSEPQSRTTLLSPSDAFSQQRPRSEGGSVEGSQSWGIDGENMNNPSKRLSLLKLRNFSESQLATRSRAEVDRQNAPPVPVVPAIVKTAPTMDARNPELVMQEPAEQRKVRTSLFKRSPSKGRSPAKRDMRRSLDERGSERKSLSARWKIKHTKSSALDDLPRLASLHASENNPPPSYNDAPNSTLALPVSDPRFSDSSRSDGSNGSSEHIYGSTTTTTHTVQTHTTFFRLSRRDKSRKSLFPLPIKIPPPEEGSTQPEEVLTPRPSNVARSARSSQAPGELREPPTMIARRHTDTRSGKRDSRRPPLPANFLAKQSIANAESGLGLLRNSSQRSRASSSSSPLQPPMHFFNRERASTGSSFGRNSHDMGTPPPFSTGSGRNSTSTTGRTSLGGLLTLSRFRQGSEPHSPRHGSPGTYSKNNSFALSREALVVPEREEGDTPGKYLERLENAVARSMIAGILSKSADPFAQAVLRSYTRRFAFFGEPVDMSLRKFLLEADLPKETQQVDRVIQAFADRYHECNPGIFVAPDQAYIIAFSLMMLHTDAFNKNNKRKMQKQDYIKNTSGQQVSDDILGCFYDNICYTQFVHYEEEVDINGERVLPFKTKKTKPKGAVIESGKKPSGPVDPYNLLVDQKLDTLRPAIKDFINTNDPYNYKAQNVELDPQYLQRAFTHTGVLQIISARSRPTAYEGNLTNVPDPNNTQAGIIDLKITKVGILWRKSSKRKTARSPWQEWGAILTGSQLYLFKNAHWAKGLVHQFRDQQKPAHPRVPVVFKPPLQDFKPDDLIKTDNAVALMDSTYTRHKNAFLFVRPAGQEEVLLAENENELHDWLALINYAAAFRTAGVRIRGMVTGTEEDWRTRGGNKVDPSTGGSPRSLKTIQTAHGEMSIENKGLSPQLQRQVMAARRQIMIQKINETTTEITEASKNLDNLLRSARHLLVLAPITPKAREDVIHAAARADASIKWTRRNIWRLKCHTDILAMDVQQDGVAISETQGSAETTHENSTETTKKTRPKGLARFSSRTGTIKSPPQSPMSPDLTGRTSLTGRPSLAESADTYPGNEVFRTPPETAVDHRDVEWTLPPLQLDGTVSDMHRGSITSTLLSVSSQDKRSLSHASSMSSIQPSVRLNSVENTTESAARDLRSPEAIIDNRTIEMIARTSRTPEPVASNTREVEATSPPSGTAETKQKSSVRRSLHKTLRETTHPSIHKHKRAKDSDSTIRTVTGDRSGSGTVEEAEEGTPGLKREKARFILHGKQASVVEFGGDWNSERMKSRRKPWSEDKTTEGDATDDAEMDEHVFHRPSIVERSENASNAVIFREIHHQRLNEAETEESDATSATSAQSPGFREDAEAAEAYASASANLRDAGLETYFDADEEPVKNSAQVQNRDTIIGPSLSLPSTTDTTDEELVENPGEEEFSAPNTNRNTVIGPSIRIVHANGSISTTSEAASSGSNSEEEEEEDAENEGEKQSAAEHIRSNSMAEDALHRVNRTGVMVQ